MKKDNYLLAFMLGLIVTIGLPDRARGTIVFDNFTAGQTLSQFGAGTTSQTTVSSSIFGGERFDSLTVRDLGGAEFFGAMGFNGSFAIGQGSDDQISGSLTYDNFRDADFTEGGFNDHFGLTFSGNDLDFTLGGVFQILVNSNGSSWVVDVDIPAGNTLPDTVDVSFSEFKGIDFTQVDSIQLLFDFSSNPGRDFVLASFGASSSLGSGSAIPEPASVLVIALLGGISVLRRRT